jgi:hypothetical protein
MDRKQPLLDSRGSEAGRASEGHTLPDGRASWKNAG